MKTQRCTSIDSQRQIKAVIVTIITVMYKTNSDSLEPPSSFLRTKKTEERNRYKKKQVKKWERQEKYDSKV